VRPKKAFTAEVVVVLNTLRSKRAEYNAGRAVCDLLEVSRVHYKVIDHNKDARVAHGHGAHLAEENAIDRLKAHGLLCCDDAGQPVCPQVFIDGHLIGDADAIQELADEQLLLPMARRQVCVSCHTQRRGQKCTCGVDTTELLPGFMKLEDVRTSAFEGCSEVESEPDFQSLGPDIPADMFHTARAPVSETSATVAVDVLPPLPSIGRLSISIEEKELEMIERRAAVEYELALLDKSLDKDAPPPPPLSSPAALDPGSGELLVGPSMRIIVLSQKALSVPTESGEVPFHDLQGVAAENNATGSAVLLRTKSLPKPVSPLCGHLWKKSPKTMRLNSWDRRYVIVHNMRLYYYKAESEAPPLHLLPENGGDMAKGVIDFQADRVDIGFSDTGSCAFTLRPAGGQWDDTEVAKRASRRGRRTKLDDQARIFNFDTKQSEFNRSHWVAHIRSHIRRAEALRTAG